MQLLKQPVFYVIILVTIIVTVTWGYVANKKKAATSSQTSTTQTDTKISNLTNLDPTDFDSQVKSEYTLASNKALESNPAYKLSQIEIQIGSNLMPESISTRYIFSSTGDTNNNWMITISAVSSNYIRALIPKSDYAGNLQQIDTKLWKYNYVTALQLAERNGGQEWRDANTLIGVHVTLSSTNSKNQLMWTVEYQSDNGNKLLQFDANSGSLIED